MKSTPESLLIGAHFEPTESWLLIVMIGLKNRSLFFRSKKSLTALSSQRSLETKKVTTGDKCLKMIIVMITVFILLKLPKRLDLKSYYRGGYTIIFKHLSQVTRSMSISNSAVNFLIYFASGKQFRDKFWQAFPCLSRGGERKK